MSGAYAMGAFDCGPWGRGGHGRKAAKMAGAAFLAMAAARHHGRGRGRGRGGPWGSGPWGGPFGPGFGFGGPPGGSWGSWGRGPKAKRGDVRSAILTLLAEEPRNGYQIIQEIAERSEGAWKPSPGAVYPALQQLTDEGLVRAEETDGKRTFHLTDEGRAYVEEHAGDHEAPWEAMTPQWDDSVHDLFRLGRQSAAALFQVVQTGSPGQIRKAKDVLEDSRRRLYQILAEDDETGDETD